MAHHLFQVALHNNSGLPRDDSVNVLFFDVNFPDTLIGVMDDVAAAYSALGPKIQVTFQGMTVKAYAPAGGAPQEVKNYAFGGGANPCPTEVALCLSYSATDNAAGAPRFRGRIYLPLSGASVRPLEAQRTALLAFGQSLGSAGNAGNATWKMLSRVGTGTPAAPVPTFRKIESISVDDEWDTQRRRGMRALTRTRQDVQ
jgi:hypothetical protein